MKKHLYEAEKELIHTVRYHPAISMILPFEPKLSLRTELEHRLKFAYDKVQRMLRENYPPEKADALLEKLSKLLEDLNFNTFKKSICIYISPIKEKVYYLDIPVEEKIVIDESFEIRDLVYNRKESHKYLVLLLSAERNMIYLGNGGQMLRLKSGLPDHVAAVTNDVSERVSNFSDPQSRKEVLLEKFLRLTDEHLEQILKTYSLPVFVLGTHRTAGHFKHITRHARNIVQYVHGNFEQATDAELHRVLQPAMQRWRASRQQQLMEQLDQAMGAGRLITGIHEVWKAAVGKKGRLLVVEKNYRYAAYHGADPDEIIAAEPAVNHPFYMHDAVDDAIELVLENGGDIEFVDAPLPENYEHVVLVSYY